MARILNLHPQIAIGLERYKHYIRWHNRWRLSPRLFHASRFLNIRPSESNLLPEGAPVIDTWYHELADKLAAGNLRWLGDKVPHYYSVWSTLLRRFPGCQLVCVIRDPVEIARSWENRARNSHDPWPSTNDHRRAPEEFNRMLGCLSDMQEAAGAQLKLVDYGSLVGRDPTPLRLLLNSLGLDLPERMAVQIRKLHDRHRSRPTKGATDLNERQQKWVLDRVDQSKLASIKSCLDDGVWLSS